MGLSDDLRASVGAVWERVVTHSFVIELGDGTLPQATFDVYFDQDYLFLKDWPILLRLATAKSPDIDAARRLVGFLHAGLAGEEGLFQQAFRERGLSPQDVAALEAVNAYSVKRGVPEDELPDTDRGRRYFLGLYMDREMRRAFIDMRHTFHIDGYYEGIVEFDDMPGYFEELEEFIDQVEVAESSDRVEG